MTDLDVVGPWQHELERTQMEFLTGDPFPNVVIDNFLRPDIAAELAEFPPLDATWYRYYNPIEHKYALNKFDEGSAAARVFDLMQSQEFVDLVRRATGIPTLEADPHLHGAGLHYHPRGGKLDMHLDYSMHPISKKERRVNLILYLNSEWDAGWGGDLQLWDAEFTGCKKMVPPVFNRAIIFKTNDISYHGLPAPIMCPASTGRKSLAIYYVSDAQPGANDRPKAKFRALPHQPVDARLQALYDIRATRTLTPADLEAHYPSWEAEQGNGFW
jgi:Rps23 Pro-64 3,4-dihydroxylase Tpa1-like proline 4-hydroxylase